MIKIEKIKSKDVKKAEQFCFGIFEEMGWSSAFAYGLDNLKKTFGGSGETFLLAKEKEKIVGCIGLKKLTKKKALMKRFYVAQEFRGQGLAHLLFEKIKNFAKKNKYNAIVLDVYRNNIRAKSFYEKKGFKIFKPKPNKKWPESKSAKLIEFRKLAL